MPISNYGVWTARPVSVSAETASIDPNTPHIHLFYDDGTGGIFDGARRASINVKSSSAISELVLWHIPNFEHPVNGMLAGLQPGFQGLPTQPGARALDYIRYNLVNFSEGRVLPHDIAGGPNDMIDYVMPELQAAVNRNATVHLFGEPYSDQMGIHDIHMNQGSIGQFKKYNGIWQDGAVLIHYPDENRMAALFFAFASQAMHTDEQNGHALPGSLNLSEFLMGRPVPEPGPAPAQGPAPEPIPEDRRIAIIAALANPVGPENTGNAATQPESVWLFNRSTASIPLAGWQILNKMDEAHTFSGDLWLAPGEVRRVAVPGAALSNKGSTISLLDPGGLKVDGVAYTRDDARVEGQILIFRS